MFLFKFIENISLSNQYLKIYVERSIENIKNMNNCRHYNNFTKFKTKTDNPLNIRMVFQTRNTLLPN